MTWGSPLPLDGADGGSGPTTLYSGPSTGPFVAIASVPSSAIMQTADGCGGVVTLSLTSGVLTVASAGADGRAVTLATTLEAESQPFMVSTTAGVGVTWNDAEGVHLATLAWQ